MMMVPLLKAISTSSSCHSFVIKKALAPGVTARVSDLSRDTAALPTLSNLNIDALPVMSTAERSMERTPRFLARFEKL